MFPVSFHPEKYRGHVVGYVDLGSLKKIEVYSQVWLMHDKETRGGGKKQMFTPPDPHSLESTTQFHLNRVLEYTIKITHEKFEVVECVRWVCRHGSHLKGIQVWHRRDSFEAPLAAPLPFVSLMGHLGRKTPKECTCQMLPTV
jgi:hypothetical protein